MFNKPVVNPNNYKVYKTTTRDSDFNVNWFRFFNRQVGMLIKFDLTTQSTKYLRTDSNVIASGSSHFSYSKSGRNSLSTTISYNFLVAKKLNALITTGP